MINTKIKQKLLKVLFVLTCALLILPIAISKPLTAYAYNVDGTEYNQIENSSVSVLTAIGVNSTVGSFTEFNDNIINYQLNIGYIEEFHIFARSIVDHNVVRTVGFKNSTDNENVIYSSGGSSGDIIYYSINADTVWQSYWNGTHNYKLYYGLDTTLASADMINWQYWVTLKGENGEFVTFTDLSYFMGSIAQAYNNVYDWWGVEQAQTLEEQVNINSEYYQNNILEPEPTPEPEPEPTPDPEPEPEPEPTPEPEEQPNIFGIPVSRNADKVGNLKFDFELQYPIGFDWTIDFSSFGSALNDLVHRVGMVFLIVIRNIIVLLAEIIDMIPIVNIIFSGIYWVLDQIVLLFGMAEDFFNNESWFTYTLGIVGTIWLVSLSNDNVKKVKEKRKTKKGGK